MAEDKIADQSASVAMQLKLYLLSHPELIREDFNRDMGFKTLAVQKVGLTGYTALYELPGSDGVWRTWAHVNDKIIGIDMSKLKKPLGRSFPGFWAVFGFGACVLIILVSKLYGHLGIMTREDYYDN